MNKKPVVFIEGGVAHVVTGDVLVIDLDIEGCDEDDLRDVLDKLEEAAFLYKEIDFNDEIEQVLAGIMELEADYWDDKGGEQCIRSQ